MNFHDNGTMEMELRVLIRGNALNTQDLGREKYFEKQVDLIVNIHNWVGWVVCRQDGQLDLSLSSGTSSKRPGTFSKGASFPGTEGIGAWASIVREKFKGHSPFFFL